MKLKQKNLTGVSAPCNPLSRVNPTIEKPFFNSFVAVGILSALLLLVSNLSTGPGQPAGYSSFKLKDNHSFSMAGSRQSLQKVKYFISNHHQPQKQAYIFSEYRMLVN